MNFLLKTLIFSAIVACMLTNAVLRAQSVDEVIGAHLQAVGQENMRQVKSIVSKGNVAVMGGQFQMPFTMYQMRPGMVRQESNFQGQSFVQAYDGAKAWQINPFMGSPAPAEMPADEAKEYKLMADMDGFLDNYAAKGHKVELLENEEVEGTDCYKLKVTTADGDVMTLCIDTETNMIIKSTSRRKMQGQEVELETYMSSFKLVEGIAMPMSMTQKSRGQVVTQITLSEVSLNKEIDSAIFQMPK